MLLSLGIGYIIITSWELIINLVYKVSWRASINRKQTVRLWKCIISKQRVEARALIKYAILHLANIWWNLDWNMDTHRVHHISVCLSIPPKLGKYLPKDIHHSCRSLYPAAKPEHWIEGNIKHLWRILFCGISTQRKQPDTVIHHCVCACVSNACLCN